MGNKYVYMDLMSARYAPTIGFDIEFAVRNTKGKLVSAIPFISGTKESPQWCDVGNIQRDNVALEIAVNYTQEPLRLVDFTGKVLQYALENLPKRYTIDCIPSALYPAEELTHPEAKEFGCSPDYNAITGNVNKFDGIANPLLRSFGLHVHTQNRKRTDKEVFSKRHTLASDLVLGLMSTIKDNSEAALQRRTLYGKPSCYRTKPYGVEYRTLSNYWCKSPSSLMFTIVLNRLAYRMQSNDYEEFRYIDPLEIEDVILKGDDAKATELFFKHVYSKCDPHLQSVIRDFIDRDNYQDMVTEWGLDTSRQVYTVSEATRYDYNPVRLRQIVNRYQRGV